MGLGLGLALALAFDSCYPRRLVTNPDPNPNPSPNPDPNPNPNQGRHGTLLTPRGRLKIGQKQYRDMHTPPPGFEDDLVPGTL